MLDKTERMVKAANKTIHYQYQEGLIGLMKYPSDTILAIHFPSQTDCLVLQVSESREAVVNLIIELERTSDLGISFILGSHPLLQDLIRD